MHHFETIRKLSDGAVAEVLLARSIQASRSEEVILEVFRRQLVSESGLVGRFVNEATVRRQLSHPNVARRVATGQTADGRLFLVTEPVSGETLRSYLQAHGPLSVELLARLLVPLCEGLGYLHARGLVHLNLTPANVFLPGGIDAAQPKLFDSSLSLLRGGKATAPVEGRQLVETEYMAPERLNGRRGDQRSDVYALGVLMYEALSGAPPNKGAPRETLSQSHRFPPGPLPAAAASLEPLVHLCLKPDPAERLQSAADVLRALDDLPRGATWSKGAPTPRPAVQVEQPGDILGNYELLQPIGQGGMGRVFLARHVKLQRLVALKVMLPEHAQDRSLVRRFFQEARAANQINHEHIVEIYDFVDECDRPAPRVYCVMELLKGTSLGELVRTGPLSLARAIHIIRQLCTGLDAAHRAGVIHRDVKPDNIFITERAGVPDFVKVLDFGVAKLVQGETTSQGGSDAELSIVGTPAYMAPEQAFGMETDHRADIYAVGVLLYRLLHGTVPFSGANRLELVRKRVSMPPLPLGDKTQGGELIPCELRDVVMRCLAKAPEDRPSSMQELKSLLAPFDAVTSPSLTPLPATRALPPSGESAPAGSPWVARLRSRGVMLGAGVALLSAVGVLAPRPAVPPAALAPLPVVATPRPAPAPRPLTLVRLSVQSTPAGATVSVKDSESRLGTTPLSVQVERREENVTLLLESPGAAPIERTIRLETDTAIHVAFPDAKPAAPRAKRKVTKRSAR